MSERVLRLLFIPGKVHADLKVSPPTLWEIVSVPKKGEERIRGYVATARATFKDQPSPYFCQRSYALRADIVREWERRTGERLASDLVPVAAGGKAT